MAEAESRYEKCGSVPLREHLEALRDADERLHCERREADERFSAERDRRLAEVAIEREKALKIKETADLAALGLAREIQTYKDEKANQLREQINSERGLYVTKTELTGSVDKLEALMSPLTDYVSRQQGKSVGSHETREGVRLTASGIVLLITTGISIITVVVLLMRGR